MKNLFGKIFGKQDHPGDKKPPAPGSDPSEDPEFEKTFRELLVTRALDLATGGGFESEPPNAHRVAARTLVLTAVAGRGFLEMEIADGKDDRKRFQPYFEAWLDDLGIVEECESSELEVLRAPGGALGQQERIDSIWRVEGVGVLAWALRLFDLPEYDSPTDHLALFPTLGYLRPEALRVLESPSIRAVEEIESLSKQILAYHWRVRDFSIHPEAMDFREFGTNCWFGPISMEWAKFAGGDLALAGHPIFEAPREVVADFKSSALERHIAINWLLGASEVYSETHTST